MQYKRVKCISLVFILLCATCFQAEAQVIKKRKNYFPAWTFHTDSVNIHGLSIGLWAGSGATRNTTTNGLRFELVGVGILIPMIPRSPIAQSDSEYNRRLLDPVSERINGFNVSTLGSACNCITNGVSLGGIAQINRGVNGISASMMMNFNQTHNGIQFGLYSETYKMNGLQVGGHNFSNRANGIQLGVVNKSKTGRGLQIGVLNRAENFRGIQLGLWNVNAKRKLPIINWSF